MLDPIVMVFQDNIEDEIIGETMKVSRKFGVRVDEKRLKQALYDAHSFYEEGYQNGRAAAASNWISVKERLPEESGEVLAMNLYDETTVSSVMNMHYSSKWKAFNTYDYPDESEARETELHPAFWMPMPEVPHA